MSQIFKPLETGITAIQEKRPDGVIEITVTDRKTYVTNILTRMFTKFYQLN